MAKPSAKQQPSSQASPEKHNGSSTTGKSVNEKTSNSSVPVLMALVALMAGLVTPPIWNLSQSSLSSRTLLETTAHVKFPCTDETLSQFLHQVPIHGLHIACLENGKLTLHKDAFHQEEFDDFYQGPVAVDTTLIHNWGALKSLLVQHLELTPTDAFHQPWATYSPLGQKYLTEVDDDSYSIENFSGMFLVFQGGAWIWPGVRKGFERVIRLDEQKNATLETLSLFPLVLSVQGFLTLEECEQIQTAATPTMRYSEVTLMDKDKGRPSSDFRTSQTTFLHSQMHPFLKSIERKTASLVRLPVNHQEPVQVLRYGQTEKYDSHHDFFEPSLYQQDPDTLRLIENGRRNRMITVFWYLSDVEEGGETVFPAVDRQVAPPKEEQCDSEKGLRVRPQAGKVIVFYSQTPNGALDPYSLHGACPVKEGIKWAANKWVWNSPMTYVQDSQ